MSMEFAGPRVNIAIEVQHYERLAPSIAEYEGRVIAPPDMAGRLVRIHLSNHNVWKYITLLEDAKKASAIAAGDVLPEGFEQPKTAAERKSLESAKKAAAQKSADLLQQAHELMLGLGFPTEASFSKGTDSQFHAIKDNGTIALFQSCMRMVVPEVDEADLYDEDGDEHEGDESLQEPEVWGSWVAERAGVYPTTNVLHGMCRVNVKERGADKPVVTVDVLYTQNARQLTSGDDLRAFFNDYLVPKVDGYENNANCLFRIRQADSSSSGRMINFWAYVARQSVSYVDQRGQQRRFMIPASLEETWNEAVVDGKQSSGLCRVLAAAFGLPVGSMTAEHQQYAKEIAEGVKAGTLIVEAIPGQRHRVIGDAISNLPRHQSRLQTMVEISTINEGDKKVAGFYPMMIVVQYGHPESMKSVPQQGGSIVVTRIVFDVDATAKKIDQIELEFDNA